MLGLPEHITAGLFDLDVLLTYRATIRESQWAGTVDDYLWVRAARTGEFYVPTDAESGPGAAGGAERAPADDDWLHAARAGEVYDPDAPVAGEATGGARPGTGTGAGVESDGGLPVEASQSQGPMRRLAQPEPVVGPYPGSLDYLQAMREAGLRSAVVSDSADCQEILASAGLDDVVNIRIDGLVVIEERLRSKPYPDMFLAAARRLGVAPGQCAVFAGSTAGMMSGHDGGFGFVVGVDRVGQAAALRANGGDLVVDDLTELLAVP